MKKMMFAMVAFAAVVMFACKKAESGPMQELRTAIDEMVEKMDKCNTMEEVGKVSAEIQTVFAELEKKYLDFQPTPEEEKEVDELLAKGQKAAQAAAERFVKDLSDKMGVSE